MKGCIAGRSGSSAFAPRATSGENGRSHTPHRSNSIPPERLDSSAEPLILVLVVRIWEMLRPDGLAFEMSAS